MAKKTAEEKVASAKIAAQKRSETARKSAKKRAITAEEKRLRKVYEKMPRNQMDIADGLIRRAAFMRVTLEGFEDDLGDKGSVEMFSQSDKAAPYERERPVARLYNAMNKNYQSIIKQLSDMMPKPEEGSAKPGEVDDGFDGFVHGR
ncbi:hypothetical protein PA598K_01506 [Paenibacillus sp. 598K]|uniref:hypothetical protein n=1 Tax=Paenibacillus sp. 598K TaxID=1117987 RepID=UPI000FFA6403|nr:hypothetical protein [Paenibacillus sp. 598K]GBF73221.1 hypothetical protein PA598K_01506 [Paenibacillus sp. 598K]